MTLTSQMDALISSFQGLAKGELESAGLAVRNEIVGKAKDLIFALQTPEEHAMTHTVHYMEIVATKSVMRMGVLKALPDPGQEGISLEALAKNIGAPETNLLERFLRLLVGTRFIIQGSDKKYSHTAKSQAYNGLPGSWFSGILYLGVPMWGIIPTKWMDGCSPEDRFCEPTSEKYNPFTCYYDKQGQNVWDAFPPEHMAEFQKGMSMATANFPITGAYDFGKLLNPTDDPSRIVLVDVGGGAGQCVEAILAAHPEIAPERTVVQDLPSTIAHAKDVNPSLPSPVKLMPHDFFTEQPIKNAKAYFLRWILHNWSDANSVRILKSLVAAMAPDSKILINDALVPERLDEATIHGGMMDLMMLSCAGKERTKNNFEKVFKEAGLKLNGIYEVPGSGQATIEAVLA